jgi:hypothetical protein
MNDREKAIHSYSMLYGFFRSQDSMDKEMFGEMLDRTRIALFSSISRDELILIEEECINNQEEILSFCEKMMTYIEEHK